MKLIGMKEAAKKIGVHPITLTRLAKSEKIPYYMIGSRRKFTEEDIEKYLRGSRYDTAKIADPFVSL